MSTATRVIGIVLMAAALVATSVRAEGADEPISVDRPVLDQPDGIASVINERLVTTASRTSYGAPYDLEHPICEVNLHAAYWNEHYGTPQLGTWLLLRSLDTGQSTLCVVVGTFRFEADARRLLNLAPSVADALGVDIEAGLFDIVIAEQVWNLEPPDVTRRSLLERPQDFYHRGPEQYLPLPRPESAQPLGPEAPTAADPGDPGLPGDPEVRDIVAAVPHTPPAGFAEFPWPAPPPSVPPVEFPRRFYEEADTLGSFDERLKEGLASVGYVDSSYYYVPSGFALVTRLEQINSDATPKPEAERWPPNIKVTQRWTISAYLRLLFTSEVPAGYGRVIVFAITDDDCVVASEACGGDRDAVGEDTVQQWLAAGGVRLPREMIGMPISDAHAAWAIVYEFHKSPGATPPIQTFHRDHLGLTHLVRAGIWDYFDGR